MNGWAEHDRRNEQEENEKEQAFYAAEQNFKPFEKEFVENGFIDSIGFSSRDLFIALDGTEEAEAMIREAVSGTGMGGTASSAKRRLGVRAPRASIVLDEGAEMGARPSTVAAWDVSWQNDRQHGVSDKVHHHSGL